MTRIAQWPQGFVNPTFNSTGTNLSSKMSNEIPGGSYIFPLHRRKKKPIYLVICQEINEHYGIIIVLNWSFKQAWETKCFELDGIV